MPNDLMSVWDRMAGETCSTWMVILCFRNRTTMKHHETTESKHFMLFYWMGNSSMFRKLAPERLNNDQNRARNEQPKQTGTPTASKPDPVVNKAAPKCSFCLGTGMCSVFLIMLIENQCESYS